jgi:hypothetical protein
MVLVTRRIWPPIQTLDLKFDRKHRFFGIAITSPRQQIENNLSSTTKVGRTTASESEIESPTTSFTPIDETAPESEINRELPSRKSSRAEMPMNAPSLPFLAFLRVRTGGYRSVMVDTRYLAGRHVVLLPRFAMIGERDDADAIGLEYGQAIKVRGDLVVGAIEQLDRLRSLFAAYRAEEADDPDAVEFWERLLVPLNSAIATASVVGPHSSILFAWYSGRGFFERSLRE